MKRTILSIDGHLSRRMVSKLVDAQPDGAQEAKNVPSGLPVKRNDTQDGSTRPGGHFSLDPSMGDDPITGDIDALCPGPNPMHIEALWARIMKECPDKYKGL